MKPELQRFLCELRDWLQAVHSLRPTYGPFCSRLDEVIAADLSYLQANRPLNGLLRGIDYDPVDSLSTPEGDGAST